MIHQKSQPAPLSFRHRLAQELEARRDVNKRYSVRAFAALLDVDHATLSQILRGKRSMPRGRIALWAHKLKLSPVEAAVYAALARVADDDSEIDEHRLRQWGAEMLALLAMPLHLEILRRTRTPGFRRDSRWLARELGTDVDEVNVALSRLLRLGLLEFTAPNAAWRDKTGLRDLTALNFRRYIAARIVMTPDPEKE